MVVSFQKKNQLIRTHVNNNSIFSGIEFTQNIITFYKNNHVLMEQLRVANESLFYAVQSFDNSKLKHTKVTKIINSLSKYYLRSITRNTPFGLFSGVYTSELKNITKPKEISVSYEWMYKYVKEIVLKSPNHFHVKFSPVIEEDDTRLIIKYTESGNITVNNSKALNLIKNFTKFESKTFIELVNMLQREYNSQDVEFFSNYLRTLIKSDVLIIQNIITKESSLSDIFNNIKFYDVDNDTVEFLDNATSLIETYESTQIGEGTAIFNNLNHLLNSIIPLAKDDLTVNLYGKFSNVDEVTDSEITDLNNLFEHLIKGSHPYDELHEYRMEFLEKFGVDAEIRLVDLINPVYGLGFPKYEINSNNYSNNQQNIVQHLFDESKNTHNTIILTDELLSDLENDSNVQHVKSGELLLERSGMDNSLTLGSIFGSKNPRAMWGRFHKLNDINVPDIDNTNIKTVDINSLPIREGVSGISSNKNYSQYELTLGLPEIPGKKQIFIENLLVGYNENTGELYIKDSESRDLVQFSDLNMLNLNLKNPIVKLLIGIAEQNTTWFFNHPIFQLAETQTIVPEIWYKNIRLTRKTWRLPFYTAQGNIPTFEEWYKTFKSKASALNIPRFVKSGNADALFVVDTTNIDSLNMMYKSIIKLNEDMYVLSEYEQEANNKNGELVLQYVSLNKVTNTNIREKPVYNLSDLKKPKTIQDGWVFIDIEFTNIQKRTEFLNTEIKNIFELMAPHVQKQFFIRYQNSDRPTIRYRAKSLDGFNAFNILYPLISDLHSKAKISKYSLEPYYPEIYRYGSHANISVIENVFSSESAFVLSKLQSDDVSKISIQLNLMKQVVYNLGFDPKSIKLFMESFFDLKPVNHIEGKQWLQKNKSIVNHFVSNWNSLDLHNDINLENRSRYLKQINLEILDKNQQFNLIAGLWHMSFNRLVEIDRERENNTLFVFYKMINSIVYLEK